MLFMMARNDDAQKLIESRRSGHQRWKSVSTKGKFNEIINVERYKDDES